MGTALFALGAPLPGICAWNASHPDDVAALHRRHVAAGADAVRTNTFAVRQDELPLVRRAVELAQSAGPRCTLGSMGPTASAGAAEALADAGVDGLMLETYTNGDALVAAVERTVPLGLPVIASFCPLGEPPGEDLAARLADAGASVIALGCGSGPGSLEATAATWSHWRAQDAAHRPPLWLLPNAGLPDPDGRYGLTPADLGTFAARHFARGVGAIGGCCGTRAEHTRAIADAWAAAGS